MPKRNLTISGSDGGNLLFNSSSFIERVLYTLLIKVHDLRFCSRAGSFLISSISSTSAGQNSYFEVSLIFNGIAAPPVSFSLLYHNFSHFSTRFIEFCSYNTPYEKIGNETIAFDAPFEIPDTWEWVRLREVCQLLDGEKRANEFHTIMDAKFLRGKSSSVSVDAGKFISSGDLMILVDGENSGEVFVAPIDGYMGSTFKNLWIAPCLFIDYILLFIELYRLPLKNSKVGAAKLMHPPANNKYIMHLNYTTAHTRRQRKYQESPFL
jgi:hypothetical protein